jgi:hypothetical protein
MASINSHADIFLDWRGLIEATERNPEVRDITAAELQSLKLILSEAEGYRAEQEELTALRQEMTQRLKDAEVRGKDLAIRIRSLVRGKVGPRSERLVHFNVAPIRPRKRIAPVKPPDEGTSGTRPGASVPSPAEPVG